MQIHSPTPTITTPSYTHTHTLPSSHVHPPLMLQLSGVLCEERSSQRRSTCDPVFMVMHGPSSDPEPLLSLHPEPIDGSLLRHGAFPYPFDKRSSGNTYVRPCACHALQELINASVDIETDKRNNSPAVWDPLD